MSVYTEEQFEMIRQSLVMQFGEEDGEKLFELQKRVMLIASEGVDEENMQKMQEAQAEYQKLFEELSAGIIAQSYTEEDEEDDEEDDYDNDDDDDEEDDDDDEDDDEEGATYGMDAIDEAVEELYGDQEGFGYRTMIPMRFGGNDPLDMVRIFESERGGISHWHYVTYGFSELYDKECEDEDISGYGFELTFRLKKTGEEPEKWPISLLQNIARYVFKTGNVFAAGHHMNLNSPIQVDYDTDITAIAFIEDPELPAMETPNGDVEFIEVVGITKDELDAVMCWNCEKLLKTFEEFLPLGITDIDRKSFMTKETVKQAFEEGMEKDGSSTMYIYTDFIAVSALEDGDVTLYGNDVKEEELSKEEEIPVIYFGAAHVEKIIKMIRGRLLKGRKFLIHGSECTVFFHIGNVCEIKVDSEEEDDIFVTLTEENIEEMTAKLQPKAGEYPLTSGKLNFRIVKTEITDQEGNVVEVVG